MSQITSWTETEAQDGVVGIMDWKEANTAFSDLVNPPRDTRQQAGNRTVLEVDSDPK